mmetsp:Transcript_9904/g.16651  ORF Transcript_9904/g.16651 Transcript_9904/m.16651 type:complete len:467 (+) Transcript_9904:1679-3079(+)
MDRDPVHVGVVHEPGDLVREQLAVVLGVQVRLHRLRGVELEALSDPLSEHVDRRIRLHDLVHGLLDQLLGAVEPVSVAGVQVVGQVDGQQAARGRWVDRHVVGRVVQELGPRIPLDVVRIVVAPPQLHVDPVLLSRHALELVALLVKKAGLGDVPLVLGEEQDVGAAGVHLVRLARVDRLLLHRLDLQRVQLHVEHLAEVHHDRLVDLLPEMRSEDLDERDLERGQLPVHEDARQVQLHLESDVDVGPVDGGGPPESESAVGDLAQPRALGVRQLLVLHGLLEARGLLPEEALPGGEIGSLEERVLENALDSAQGLDHVGAVVVEVPELAVVLLMSPPEGILLEDLVLLEVLTQPPPFVVGEGESVLLEEGVDAGDAAVPRVVQVLERQPPILGLCLLTLERVLRPHALRVHELRLPRLDVAVEVGDQLVLLVRHARAEVRYAGVGLLAVAKVGLGDEDVAHGEHA